MKERRLSLSHGCKSVNNLWVRNDGHVVAPTSLFLGFGSHDTRFVACEQRGDVLRDCYAQRFGEHNPGKTVQTTISIHGYKVGKQISYIWLRVRDTSILGCVDTFSNWIEAWAYRKTDSSSVINWLLKGIVPRFGIP